MLRVRRPLTLTVSDPCWGSRCRSIPATVRSYRYIILIQPLYRYSPVIQIHNPHPTTIQVQFRSYRYIILIQPIYRYSSGHTGTSSSSNYYTGTVSVIQVHNPHSITIQVQFQSYRYVFLIQPLHTTNNILHTTLLFFSLFKNNFQIIILIFRRCLKYTVVVEISTLSYLQASRRRTNR